MKKDKIEKHKIETNDIEMQEEIKSMPIGIFKIAINPKALLGALSVGIIGGIIFGVPGAIIGFIIGWVIGTVI